LNQSAKNFFTKYVSIHQTRPTIALSHQKRSIYSMNASDSKLKQS